MAYQPSSTSNHKDDDEFLETAGLIRKAEKGYSQGNTTI